jgi:signal transduction histidine kinase
MDKKVFDLSSLMMWLSLLLLATFLIYWNVNQYKQESAELKRDLDVQMALAYSSYNDSLVSSIFSFELDSLMDVTTEIKSAYAASDSVKVYVEGEETSINLSIHMDNENRGRHDFDSLIVNDTVQLIISDEANMHNTFGTSTEQSAKRDIKVIIDHLSGTADIVEEVKVIFVNQLLKENLPSEFYIDTFPKKSKVAQTLMALPFKVPMDVSVQKFAVFENFNSYLIKKIFPSLLMSSILFGFVSLAFYMIARARKNQENLIQMKSEFISNMTHELKTPIATVGVALESLSNFGLIENAAKRQEYFNISKHEINRLNILVDKVMKMSAFNSGEVTMKFERVDIRELLEEMLKSMSLHFDKHMVDIQYDATGENFNVLGDQVHLTNMLYNLLDNAIKYSKNKPEVDISIIEESEVVLLSIEDKGIGIPKEYQSIVFDRFFRVPSQDIHEVKGHGIGLNYSADVVRKHNGTIQLESIFGKGTTFIIKIPKVK